MEKKENPPKKAPKKDKPPYAGKKHFFFLNPYEDCAFTRCPKCENKTKERNFALVIKIDPQPPFLLNKICRYCPHCDLIIAEKNELESLISTASKKSKPDIVKNNYLVFGALQKADWRQISNSESNADELIHHTYVFKDVWNFEPVPAEWYPPDEG
jgi:hypothetical protein